MSGTDFGKLSQKIRNGDSPTVKERKLTPPEIIVTRRQDHRGLIGSLKFVRVVVSRLLSRPLVVWFDGKTIGSLARENQMVRFVVPCGEHTLSVGRGRTDSVDIKIQLENGMRRRFFCGTSALSIVLREI